MARSELDLTIALQGWLARRLNRTMLLATEAMVTDVDLEEDHWGMVEALRERDRAGVERLAVVIAARERVLTLDALR